MATPDVLVPANARCFEREAVNLVRELNIRNVLAGVFQRFGHQLRLTDMNAFVVGSMPQKHRDVDVRGMPQW